MALSQREWVILDAMQKNQQSKHKTDVFCSYNLRLQSRTLQQILLSYCKLNSSNLIGSLAVIMRL
jgi:hypothetical protein